MSDPLEAGSGLAKEAADLSAAGEFKLALIAFIAAMQAVAEWHAYQLAKARRLDDATANLEHPDAP